MQYTEDKDIPTDITIYGKIVSGLGEGKIFVELPWAKEQFINKVGIDPYPGTLNLKLEDPETLKGLQKLKSHPGIVIVPDNPTSCQGICYKIMIREKIPGAIVIPLVPGYPNDKVEIIAPFNLKELLKVKDGDEIKVAVIRD